jgi:hypothetical protein
VYNNIAVRDLRAIFARAASSHCVRVAAQQCLVTFAVFGVDQNEYVTVMELKKNK